MNHKYVVELTGKERESLRSLIKKGKTQAKQFNAALDEALAAARPKNLKAVMALLDMDKVSMVDGKLNGLEEQLEALQKAPDSSFLFEPEQPRRTGLSHQYGEEGGFNGLRAYAQAHDSGALDSDIADAFKPKGTR